MQLTEGGKAASVSGGALIIDGTGSATGRTVVRLPLAYHTTTDFTFEADFTITSSVNIARWGSLIFRMSDGDAPLYHQMAVRQEATGGSGVELATWPGGDWQVHKCASYTENISASSTYRLKVVASGTTVKEYINNKLLIEYDNLAYTEGGFGIGCAGAVVKIDNVSITGTMKTSLTEDGYYFKDDFSEHPTGGWHSDYNLGDCQPYATVGVHDGRMIIDSTNANVSPTGLTSIFLPE